MPGLELQEFGEVAEVRPLVLAGELGSGSRAGVPSARQELGGILQRPRRKGRRGHRLLDDDDYRAAVTPN